MNEKKYEEVVKKLQEALAPKDGLEISGLTRKCLEEIFPELRESEDERIRKELIEYIRKTTCVNFIGKLSKKEAEKFISCLEKQSKVEEAMRDVEQKAKAFTEANKGLTSDEILAQMRGEQKPANKVEPKFKVGDIILNGKAVFRVDGITKNCLGQDCYFLVNVESEKDGTRYLKLTNSEGKFYNSGEITWLCEQVDAKFEKQGEQKAINDTAEDIVEAVKDTSILDMVEPKFKVGDWCIDNEDGVIFQIVKVLDNTYTYKTNEGKKYSCSHYSLENDAHLWTIQDAKDGDVLVYKDEISLYKHDIKNCTKQKTNFGGFVYYCCYDSKRFIVNSFYSLIEQDKMDIHPATKEQRELLFQKMHEAGYEWDAEKKELKKIEDEEYNGEDYGIDSLWHAKNILEKTLGKVDGYQSDDGILEHKCAITAVKKLYEKKPTLEDTAKAFLQALSDTPYNNTPVVDAQIITKQLLTFMSDRKAYDPDAINKHKSAEWSEEDEKMVIALMSICDEWATRHSYLPKENNDIEKIKRWLKSLRPQKQWKPSKEQIDALDEVYKTHGANSACRRVLITLLNDLKKLTE